MTTLVQDSERAAEIAVKGNKQAKNRKAPVKNPGLCSLRQVALLRNRAAHPAGVRTIKAVQLIKFVRSSAEIAAALPYATKTGRRVGVAAGWLADQAFAGRHLSPRYKGCQVFELLFLMAGSWLLASGRRAGL